MSSSSSLHLRLTFIYKGNPLGEFFLEPTTDFKTVSALLSGVIGSVPAEHIRLSRAGNASATRTETSLAANTTLEALGFCTGDMILVNDARDVGVGGGGAAGGGGGGGGTLAATLRALKRAAPSGSRRPLDAASLASFSADAMFEAQATPDEWYAALKINSLLRSEVKRDAELISAANESTAGPLRALFIRRSLDHSLPVATHIAALRDAEIRLARDPFDAAAQRVVEAEISRRNVDANRELAHDVMPEAFVQNEMLRIRLSVNGVPCLALVDSGAQTTIISSRTAERCGITRLIDTRCAGMAVGVGTGVITGKVHLASLTLGGESFTASFTVMEKTDMEFLLGLDLLRRFAAVIHLGKNVLQLHTGGKVVEVPFLTTIEIAESYQEGSSSPRAPKQRPVGGAGASDDGVIDGVIDMTSDDTPPSLPHPPPLPPSPAFPSTSSMAAGGGGGGGGGGTITTISSSTTLPPPPSFNLSGLLPATSASASSAASSITAITNIGFSHERAVAALAAVGGDVDAAITLLLEE
jgi:hypothetical protein